MIPNIPYESKDRLKSWLLAATEITQALVQEEDLRKALDLVARRLREVSAADYVSISLVDPRYPEGTAIIEAIAGLGAERLSGQIIVNHKQAVWTKVAQSGKGIISRDLTHHPAFDPPTELAEAMSGVGVAMYLPLVAVGKVLGVMCAGWMRGSPYEGIAMQEVPFMEMFAGEVALAMQRARAQVMVMEDRDRIAKELEEVALNRLFAIGTQLHVTSGMAAGQDELRQRLRHAIDDLDDTIRQIGPAIFALSESETPGRQPVSTRLVEEVDAASNLLGFTPRLVVHGLLDHRLPAQAGSELVHAVHESLAHAASHRSVSSVEVNVSLTDDQLSLTVSDDGQTVNPQVRPNAVGWLEEEARRLGGTVAVHPSTPTGMVLSWRVPISGGGRSARGIGYALARR